MNKTIIRILWIVVFAVLAYLGWNLWYYYPLREKKARTFEVVKQQF